MITYLALRAGAVEANPMVNGLTSSIGEIPGYGIKLLFAAMVAFVIYKTRKAFLFKWLNLGMGIVVLFNIAVLAYCTMM